MDNNDHSPIERYTNYEERASYNKLVDELRKQKKQLEGEVRRLKSLLHQLFNLKTYHSTQITAQSLYIKNQVYGLDKPLYREIEEELAK